jgi:hypothetical protein
MKILRNTLLTIALLSCDGTQALHDPDQPSDELYICHSPHTPEHGKLCTDKCYEPGNPHTFCWLITRDSCNYEHQHEWQKENCHFFD